VSTVAELKNRVWERADEVVVNVGSKVLAQVDRLIARTSLVEDRPFLATDDLPWARDLESGFPAIRAELDQVLQWQTDLPNFQDISADQATITDDDRWKTFILYGYGFRSEANCARCPETARLVSQVPGMTTALFSILAPHKHIGEHRGPYKGVMRYHLALRIPEPTEACGIRVGGELAHWQEGHGLLFDDTYEHEAWNDTDGVRVVLFMDVIRPLRPPAKQLNQAVIKAIAWSPYVQNAKRKEEAWEQRFEQLRSGSRRA
jgi:beta-hydroxylase